MFALLLFHFDADGAWSHLFIQHKNFLFDNGNLPLLLLLLNDKRCSDHHASRSIRVLLLILRLLLLLLLLLLLVLSRSRRLRDTRDHLSHLRWRDLSHSSQRGRSDGLGQLRSQRSGSAKQRPRRRRRWPCCWRQGIKNVTRWILFLRKMQRQSIMSSSRSKLITNRFGRASLLENLQFYLKFKFELNIRKRIDCFSTGC